MIDWKSRALKAEAELQMLAATEPVAWINLAASSKMFRFLAPTEEDGTVVKDWQPLFTHPMPAQDVTELVERLGKVNVGLLDGITKAKGCFKAANFEGLPEALAETTDERLKDLVERRLLYVPDYLETALSNAKGVKL